MEYEKFKKVMATLGLRLETFYEPNRLETQVIDEDADKVICNISEKEEFVLTYTKYGLYQNSKDQLLQFSELVYRYAGTPLEKREFPTPFFLVLYLDGVYSQNLYLTKLACEDEGYNYKLTTSDEVSWEDRFLFTREEFEAAKKKYAGLASFKEEDVDRLRY